LKERLGLEPELQQLPIGSGLEESPADAVMLIGDRAMRRPQGGFDSIWDLGEEWSRWAGLPFVFALWVARRGAELEATAEALVEARNEGVKHLQEIARSAAPGLGVSEEECRSYLCRHLRFHLGQRERQGLETFYQLAANEGLAPGGVELVFYDQRHRR
jgi:chorismate dehydratase